MCVQEMATEIQTNHYISHDAQRCGSSSDAGFVFDTM